MKVAVSVAVEDALVKQLKALVEDEDNLVANLSNTAALLFHALDDINWLGFYLWDDADQQLVLGPFQGQVACLRIDQGKGVCGTAFSTGQTQRVDNVHDFPGHIACDAASNSELVVPLKHQGQLIGVLDIDSPSYSRFSQADQDLIESCVATINDLL